MKSPFCIEKIIKICYVKESVYENYRKEEGYSWLTIVFVELTVIFVNSKKIMVVKDAGKMRVRFFGENVIYTHVVKVKKKSIAESVQNFHVIL